MYKHINIGDYVYFSWGFHSQLYWARLTHRKNENKRSWHHHTRFLHTRHQCRYPWCMMSQKEIWHWSYHSNKMVQGWSVTSRGSLNKYLALREDLSIENGCTRYMTKLSISHTLWSCNRYSAQRTSINVPNMPKSNPEELYSIVCNQHSNIPCSRCCQQWSVRCDFGLESSIS